MSNSITELLANILAAKYGEEVRGSIHDAIELCYTDGKAGVNDLQARQLIEAVAEVNEQQQAALEVLQARVEELESGEGGSSQQSTTIDIPTVLVDGGVVENVSVNNNSTTTRHITFTTEFTETPRVMVAIGKNVGAVSQYGYLSANILYPTVTTTGFDFFLANRTGSDRSPGVVWYAYQPTVKTIDLDITIPETEGMTEAEVREITGPIAAAVDALKTGYDGTTYQTAAEAVRTQINDLHVLIGDEPGTAISADSIGYEDGSVADALAGLNGRLDQLDGGLTADVKAALLACFNHVAWDSDDPTGQSYISALQTALYPPANLSSISAVFTQSGTVYDSDALDSLKSSLVVTAHYSDSTTETISNYTLSGTLTEGTSTITVTYGGKTTTFTVTVTSSHVSNPYLADNMILWLDGIYNKSTGHDEYSTVWEDLISGETFTNTGITVATDGMVFDGTAGHGFLGDAPSNIGTIEILLDVTNPSTTQAVIGGFGNNDPGNVSVKSGNLLQRKGSTNGGGHAIPTGLHTHTFVIGGSQYVDGESVSNVATTISFTSTGKMSIGNALNAIQGLDTGSGAYPLTGTIKCIRLYSDLLTAEEVASNYAVDVTRFNLS